MIARFVLKNHWDNLISMNENIQLLKYKFNIPQEVINWADDINEKFSTWIVFSALKDYYNTNDLSKIKNALELEDIRMLMHYINDQKETMTNIVKNLFLVHPKPKLNLKTLTIDAANRYASYTSLISDWAAENNINLEKLDWEDAIGDAIEWKSEDFHNISKVESGDVFLKFDDGYYWTNLKKQYCSDEALIMGHCGRTAGDVLFSLRDKRKKSHLTAGYSYKDKKIVGLKGRGNTKPKKKYHKYIIALLKNKKYPISGFNLEYDTGTDFKLSDLNEDLKDVFTKPDVSSLKWIIFNFLALPRTGWTTEYNRGWKPTHYKKIDPKIKKYKQAWRQEELKNIIYIFIKPIYDPSDTPWQTRKPVVEFSVVKYFPGKKEEPIRKTGAAAVKLIRDENGREHFSTTYGHYYLDEFDPIPINEEFIGTYIGEWNNEKEVEVYKNPPTIRRMGEWNRGISDDKGNFFIADEEDTTHYEIKKFLKQYSYKFNGENHIMWHRYKNSNNFFLSEIYDLDDYLSPNRQNLINKVKEKNPKFNFSNISINEFD